MGGGRSDTHRTAAGRAERLATNALRHLAATRAKAEFHEQLASDDVADGWHRRAAAFYRDAGLIYEQAAALQVAHAAHERQAAAQASAGYHVIGARRRPAGPGDRSDVLARREALADARDQTADARQLAADERDRSADARELAADERDRGADAREFAADERDRSADRRDRTADDRDAVATAREDQIEARERDAGEIPDSLRFTAEQRAQLARIQTAIRRTKERVIRDAHGLHRADPR